MTDSTPVPRSGVPAVQVMFLEQGRVQSGFWQLACLEEVGAGVRSGTNPWQGSLL